jgi:hypothetical protein
VTLELALRLAGALQIALAAMHVVFPNRFDWKEELARLSLLNRQMFLVHTVFICVVLVLVGSLSLLAPHALLEPTPLSRLVLGGIAAFWGLRLVVQLFVYDTRLWRGNRFNTLVHVVFCVLWAYLVAVYAGAFLRQAGALH